MKPNPLFNGLYVPLVTPFTDDLRLAPDALARLADEALSAGSSGLVALGTTAESATLTTEEKQTVVRICSAACQAHDAPLIVGVGTNDTAAAIKSLRELATTGDVAAALVPAPPYIRPGEAGTLAHFAALAEHGGIPLIVYDIPYRTGQTLSAGAIDALGRLPGIVGIKHATGAIDATTMELLGSPPPGFAVLGGDDIVISPLVAAGAHGGIVASANLRTADYAELISLWHLGSAAPARKLGAELAQFSAALFAEPNPTVIKGVLHAQDRIPSPAVRMPLLAASTSTVHRATLLADSRVREATTG
ncbi:4-hydroxy-tetrahydrodipicolinate synthase [Streptomyces sp. RPA4-5]|uniref:4-hydroxy-tetrahydrodipicolinate synthase family protein n=1 Tax=unclassified Streptomyces TaxID=2593676 RepID=UPI00143E9BCE|nr:MULTISPECIES: 4-hydroxy-tetrahydrodipicolinate synthase [unclassified Streptomyces]QIY59255.1 4-hydroxy-tetrahydrodipicolinate synthase [Streptomyces sp. RPA4-5]WJY42489.1 4-hydroxy-tetrahydrodipicolinate synthase [Streptomyces sp. P9-2B-2]